MNIYKNQFVCIPLAPSLLIIDLLFEDCLTKSAKLIFDWFPNKKVEEVFVVVDEIGVENWNPVGLEKLVKEKPLLLVLSDLDGDVLFWSSFVVVTIWVSFARYRNKMLFRNKNQYLTKLLWYFWRRIIGWRRF